MTRICPHCQRPALREDGSCMRCYYVPDPTRDYAPEPPTEKRAYTNHERAFRFAIVLSFLFALIVCGAGLYRALT